jgi:hypothetical protein
LDALGQGYFLPGVSLNNIGGLSENVVQTLASLLDGPPAGSLGLQECFVSVHSQADHLGLEVVEHEMQFVPGPLDDDFRGLLGRGAHMWSENRLFLPHRIANTTAHRLFDVPRLCQENIEHRSNRTGKLLQFLSKVSEWDCGIREQGRGHVGYAASVPARRRKHGVCRDVEGIGGRLQDRRGFRNLVGGRLNS